MLEAATELFLRDGYDQTSIDAILERSGGSKATLYNYFPTKEDLFRVVVDSLVSNAPQPSLGDHEDVRRTLTRFGAERLAALFSSSHRALLRLIIAERERFPDLARLYYTRGPQRTQAVLAEYLRNASERGALQVDDPEEAAEFFMGMLQHRWYKELLLIGGESPSEEEIGRRAERVVDRLLASYQRKPH
ncbi:MAG TPA: TetR/AcrR family transcriptional regulator [Gammaproteobacteria bacterium]